MKVVGLISCYREGALILGAIDSLLKVGLDELLVYEGPAGEIPEGIEAAPESKLPQQVTPGYLLHRGRWRTDARKRNEMLQEAKLHYPGEDSLWGVWLDGDEVLMNAELLRDRLQAITWGDEWEREVVYEEKPEDWEPTIHWPLRTVESDGSVAVTMGRLVRLDLIRSYDVSVSAVTNMKGIREGFGNEQEDARVWMEIWMQATEAGRMIAWPPLPGEPYIVHRANLRHPARRGLRLHHQEAVELKKAGLDSGRR